MSPTPTSDSKSSDWAIQNNPDSNKNRSQSIDPYSFMDVKSTTPNKPTNKFNFKNNFMKLCMPATPHDRPSSCVNDEDTERSAEEHPNPNVDVNSIASTRQPDSHLHQSPVLTKPRLKRRGKFHLSDQKYVAPITQTIKQDVEKAAQDIKHSSSIFKKASNWPDKFGGKAEYVPIISRRGNRCLHLWSDVEDNAPPHRKSKMLNDEEMTKYMKKYNFKERQVIDYEEAFLVFDLDVDGVITVDELGTVMVALGQRPSLEEIQALIQGVDSDNSGTVDFDEFLGMMAARMHSDPEEELKEVFGVFDSDSDGYISAYELYDVLSRLDDSITKDEVDFMIKEADTNGDGKVDFSEFQNILHGK